MEVIDIGRLIECVQERTFLWNEKNNHFRDRKARDMAWIEIAEEMCDNWSELSKTEKNDKAKALKEKWKHLKDSYARSIRFGHNNIYGDSLYFLRDNFLERKSSLPPKKKANAKKKAKKDTLEANENSSSDSFQNTNGLNNAQPSLPQETSDCSSDSIQTTNRPRTVQPNISQGSSDHSASKSVQNSNRLVKNSKRSSLPPKTIKKPEPNKVVQEKASPEEEKDDDKCFLVSLLHDYRELSEDDKLDFRIMTLQYIRNARKKKNLKNPSSSINSSQQWHSVPMQITPD